MPIAIIIYMTAKTADPQEIHKRSITCRHWIENELQAALRKRTKQNSSKATIAVKVQ